MLKNMPINTNPYSSSLKKILCVLLVLTATSCKENPVQPLSIKHLKADVAAEDSPEAKDKFHFHHAESWLVDEYSVNITAWGRDNSTSLSQCLIEVTTKNEVVSQKFDVDGSVVGSCVTDLDSDGFFEVIIWSQSAGSGSYGDIFVHKWTDGRLTEIGLPDLTAKQTDGYMGHDLFSVAEDRIVREFPLYHLVDSNAEPTDGQREIQYRLQGNQWKCVTHDIFIEKVKGQIKRIRKKLQ